MSALQWIIFASSVHFDISHTDFDDSGCESFTRYSSDPMQLWYLFCISLDIFVPISCLRTIPLCGVSRVFKGVINCTSLLNPWVIFAIRWGWEILRVVLLRPRLIVHLKKYSSGTIYRVIYYFLMYLIVYINIALCLSTTSTSTYYYLPGFVGATRSSMLK